MELLLDYSCFSEFEPEKSFLFGFFVERGPFRTSRIDYGCSIDHLLLMVVEMPCGEKLEVSWDRGFLDVGFLAKITVEAFDGVVCEEDVDVSFSIDRMLCEWVSFSWERWVQTHPDNVDDFA